MNAFTEWLSAAPQGAIAVMTGLLAAAVAIIVTFITQWILGRRARTELLTKKLEELYLVLNEVSAHNVNRAEAALPLVTATPFEKTNITGSSIERQALDHHKKVIMLVRLYFPRLSHAHQEVFRRNNDVNMLIHKAEVGPPLSEHKLLSLSGLYGDALAAMEKEIILNRRVLVKDHIIPARYKQVPLIYASEINPST